MIKTIEIFYCDHCGELITDGDTWVTQRSWFRKDKHYHHMLVDEDGSCYNSYLADEPPTFLTIIRE